MFHSPAQRTFTDNFTWRLTAAFPFLVLLGFGIYFYVDAHEFEPVLWSFIAVFGLIFGYSLLWAAKRKVSLHQEGISYVSLFKSSELTWPEIKVTRYSQYAVNMGAHFGLIGYLVTAFRGQSGQMQRSLLIEGSQKMKLTPNLRDVDEAIRLVLAAVNPPMRKEAEALLSGGGTVQFGDLSLVPQGVIWKKKEPIPYSSIVKCKLDGKNLRIKAEGKWLDNVSVAAEKIPNLFVALEIIEEKRASSAPGPLTKTAAGFEKFS